MLGVPAIAAAIATFWSVKRYSRTSARWMALAATVTAASFPILTFCALSCFVPAFGGLPSLRDIAVFLSLNGGSAGIAVLIAFVLGKSSRRTG